MVDGVGRSGAAKQIDDGQAAVSDTKKSKVAVDNSGDHTASAAKQHKDNPPPLKAGAKVVVAHTAKDEVAVVKRSSPISWGSQTHLLPAYIGNDPIFMREVPEDKAKKTADAIAGLVKPIVADVMESGKKVLLVMTVGASNGSANGTNPSAGVENNKKLNAELRQQQSPDFRGVPEDTYVVHVRIDSHSETTAAPWENDRGTTIDVSGAYPLTDESRNKGSAGDIQRNMEGIAKQVVQRGGQFMVRNFVTDKLYPGLVHALRVTARAASEERTDACRVAYMNQYLGGDDSTVVNALTIIGDRGKFTPNAPTAGGSLNDLPIAHMFPRLNELEDSSQ